MAVWSLDELWILLAKAKFCLYAAPRTRVYTVVAVSRACGSVTYVSDDNTMSCLYYMAWSFSARLRVISRTGHRGAARGGAGAASGPLRDWCALRGALLMAAGPSGRRRGDASEVFVRLGV